MNSLIKAPFLLFFSFFVFFITKIFNYLDVSLLILLFISFLVYFNKKYYCQYIPNYLINIIIFLFILFIYSSFISFLNGANEFIWSLKFLKTSILIFLIYFWFLYFSRKYNYDEFKTIIIIFVCIHSVIIFCAVSSPIFRELLYSITGFQIRGPGWSRSPGLTKSFNATAIVHLCGLWFVFIGKNSAPFKIIAGLVIFVSLFFLGRTMTYVGLLIIVLYFFRKKYLSSMILVSLMISLLFYFKGIDPNNFDEGNIRGKVELNVYHVIQPLLDFGKENGVDNYFSNSLGNHIYISDSFTTLFFGNSNSGHIGLQGGKGETDSDLGIINSINANGLFITLMLYLLYVYIVYLGRFGDWKTLLYMISLTFFLTFKETGFLVSHVTPLLFVVLFYQTNGSKNINKDDF